MVVWLGFGFETWSHYIAQLNFRFIEISLTLPSKYWE